MMTASRFGVVPKDNLACYELPSAIVSSDPELCVRAFHVIIDDALSLIREVGSGPKIWWSLGSASGRRPQPISQITLELAYIQLRPLIMGT